MADVIRARDPNYDEVMNLCRVAFQEFKDTVGLHHLDEVQQLELGDCIAVDPISEELRRQQYDPNLPVKDRVYAFRQNLEHHQALALYVLQRSEEVRRNSRITLGSELKRLRTSRRMTKYALERASLVDHSLIHRIEEKEHVPAPEILTRLSRGLHLSDEEKRRFFQRAIEQIAERYDTELARS